MSVVETSTKSKYFLTLILTLIGLGFALSTCNNIKQPLSSGNVASVNGVEITYEQYMQMLQQTGLTELNAKQLRELNIGKNIVNQMISKELIGQWGEKIGLAPSKEEIAQEVKSLPYFLDDRKEFDLARYKAILEANHLSPQQFEDRIAKDILTRRSAQNASWIPISSYEAKYRFMAQNTGNTIAVAKFKPSSLKSFIEIPSSEVKAFVNETKNFNILKNLYERNQYKYIVPASQKVLTVSAAPKDDQQKAALIDELKKIKNNMTSAEFTKAANAFVKVDKDHRMTMDQGWLSDENMNFPTEVKQKISKAKKSQLVGPEIIDGQTILFYIEDTKSAKNINFDQAKNDLALEYLRQQKTSELDKMSQEWQHKIQQLVNNNNVGELKKLEKSIGLEWKDQLLLSKMAQNIDGNSVDSEQLLKIAKANKGDTFIIKSLADILIIKVINTVSMNDASLMKKWNEQAAQEQQNLEKQQGGEMIENLLIQLRKKARVKINEQII